ncbi:MAG: hypothetical protein QOD58_2079 [Mycobacterium sp.]|jgi:hypothetical protein|nr:hypothetical protein [Mycobacterium sp.]
MAIMPHCVVCGYHSANRCAGEVAFADFDPTPPPESLQHSQGWSNSLGITASEGVGQFCAAHLELAQNLRHLTSHEAVKWLRQNAPPDLSKMRARLRCRLQ